MQVINNLISNAIKFTPDGGRIELAVAQEPGRVLISVADDGIGIPEALQPVLFERFTPARRSGLRGEKTTGLGMSIIKTIVGLHEGRIICQSTENEGSTFTIELPRRKAAFNQPGRAMWHVTGFIRKGDAGAVSPAAG
jgi:two-component system sensor histidine kinase VicK